VKGRKPKSSAVRRLERNPGRRPIAMDLDVRPVERLEAPRWLQGIAKREWERLAPELRDAKLLTERDRMALAAYCQASARWVRAEEMIGRTGGPVLETEKGYRYPNPWSAQARKMAELMLKTAMEFGFTPASRTRVARAQEAATADLIERALG